jgi:hypothetical protein
MIKYSIVLNVLYWGQSRSLEARVTLYNNMAPAPPKFRRFSQLSPTTMASNWLYCRIQGPQPKGAVPYHGTLRVIARVNKEEG